MQLRALDILSTTGSLLVLPFGMVHPPDLCNSRPRIALRPGCLLGPWLRPRRECITPAATIVTPLQFWTNVPFCGRRHHDANILRQQEVLGKSLLRSLGLLLSGSLSSLRLKFLPAAVLIRGGFHRFAMDVRVVYLIQDLHL